MPDRILNLFPLPPMTILLICIAAGFATACGGSTQNGSPADKVVVNGSVITVDGNSSTAEAVAIRDGIFVAVGTNDEIESYIGTNTEVIDAENRTVVPGLIESHVHATGAARGEAVQPFIQLGSIQEMQDWVRTEADKKPAGEWIRLPRVDVTRIEEGRIPVPEELDAAAPDHPTVFIWQFATSQTQVLNTAAVQAAGITANTEAPEGGSIRFDEYGAVLQDSNALTAEFLQRPEISDEEYLNSLEQLLKKYTTYGITSIFERNSNVTGYNNLHALKEAGRLPVRVTTTIGISTDGTAEDTENILQELPFSFGDGDDRLRVGPLKIRIDGGVLYGSAYMREPYGEQAGSFYGFDDPEFRGTLLMTPQEIKDVMRTGHERGWQMSAHVTGDAGVDIVLDAIEEMQDGGEDRRHTLIHAYFANNETAERAERLGVGIDTQPAWYYKDGDALAGALGEDRLERFIGLQVWQEAGAKVALNSDHMQGADGDLSLNPYNPFLTMYAAITRKTEHGQVIGEDQQISREDALRMMTIDAAWLSFDEDKKGSIEVGKMADLAVLSGDLLNMDIEEVKNLRSVTTIVDGEVVYSSGEPAGR